MQRIKITSAFKRLTFNRRSVIQANSKKNYNQFSNAKQTNKLKKKNKCFVRQEKRNKNKIYFTLLKKLKEMKNKWIKNKVNVQMSLKNKIDKNKSNKKNKQLNFTYWKNVKKSYYTYIYKPKQFFTKKKITYKNKLFSKQWLFPNKS